MNNKYEPLALYMRNIIIAQTAIVEKKEYLNTKKFIFTKNNIAKKIVRLLNLQYLDYGLKI